MIRMRLVPANEKLGRQGSLNGGIVVTVELWIERP